MIRTALFLAVPLLLAGCATPAFVSPVEVTRFTAPSDAFLAQGTIAIIPAPGIDAAAPGYAAFEDAVRRELEQLGYRTVARNGSQTATLSLSHSVSMPERRNPVSVGGGGSVGSYGSGIGVGIGLDLTPRRGEAVSTQLAVSIRRTDGSNNLWEGRAQMSATSNSEYPTPADAATRIAAALFRGFPGTSGETIAVP